MTTTCVNITVTSPPPPGNITATSQTVSAGGPGQILVSAMVWKNEGGQAATFTPKVSLNGTLHDFGLGVKTVQPGATFSLATSYTISNLSAGVYSVCPSPN